MNTSRPQVPVAKSNAAPQQPALNTKPLEQSFIQGCYQINRTITSKGQIIHEQRVLLSALEDNHI